MFDKVFGVSKKTFLQKKIVRGSVNDRFYVNKCTFCWGPYDESHIAVRVQPCNHIFGRDCLEQMINAPNGDHCPLCRSLWLRPPLEVCIEDMFQNGYDFLMLYLTLVYSKLNALWHRFPAWMTFPVRCWYWMHNTCYHIDILLRRHTNVYARNPSFNMTRTILYFQFSMCILGHLRTWLDEHRVLLKEKIGFTPPADNSRMRELDFATMTLSVLCITGITHKLGGWRDRAIFGMAMAIVLVLHFGVAKLSGWFVLGLILSSRK